MSDIIWGKITSVGADGLTIRTERPNMEHLLVRECDEVRVELIDSRHITPVQNRKAHAIMNDIAEWSGLTLEEVKLNMKYRFLKESIDTLKKGLIMMRNANVTEAKDFISMLI